MLKVILNGALGNDATVKDVGNKKAINFDVAVSMDYKDSSGNKVEKTEWYELLCGNMRADFSWSSFVLYASLDGMPSIKTF